MKHYLLHTLKPAAISAFVAMVSLSASAGSKAVHKHFRAVVDTVSSDESADMPTPKLFSRELPRLLLTGKAGRFYVGMGGGLKATVGMDWGSPTSDPNSYVISDIPMMQPEGNGAQFRVSAQQTELFICFGAMPGQKYEVGAYINGMFMGDNYAFKLENAYVRFLGFTAGYGYGLFYDTEAGPATIDYQGPLSMLSSSHGIIDYQWDITPRWSVGAGIEVPVVSYAATDHTERIRQRVPDIPAMVQYNFPTGGHLRASAILRTIQYRDLVSNVNRSCMGYGLQLSGYGPIVGPLGYYFQGAFGRGINAYFQDVKAKDMDLMPVADNPGRMEAVKSWGGYAALQYDITPTVHASVMYSHLRLYPHNAQPDCYRYGQYAAANVIWNVNPIVSCGLEYIYGRRVNVDGQQAHNNRLQAMFKVSF